MLGCRGQTVYTLWIPGLESSPIGADLQQLGAIIVLVYSKVCGVKLSLYRCSRCGCRSAVAALALAGALVVCVVAVVLVIVVVAIVGNKGIGLDLGNGVFKE